MRTEHTPVAEGVELATDRWEATAADAPPFLLVHGLASNARNSVPTVADDLAVLIERITTVMHETTIHGFFE